MNQHLANITPEQRKEMQRQSALRRAARQVWAKENLKLDWADEQHWRSLASKYGVRLPSWYIPASEVKHIKRLFKNLNLDIKDYLEAQGYATLKKMEQDNPTMPAFASVGFALEYIDGLGNAMEIN